ncbi:DUF6392 family protein [Vibrio jasicida]|uniref:DUF6392 family protein n=1 Tax=Vibrio jasicida TaxID=766224 RepID=UPI00163EFFBD|nr:DUF6392 family protein [Vibrio jasicida]
MTPLFFIERIGTYTYQDFVDGEHLKGDVELDQDDIGEFSASMDKYGLTLIFAKKSSLLVCVEILNIDTIYNMLPTPLEVSMVRSDVLELLGPPIASKPPRKIISLFTGGVDQFNYKEQSSLAMLVYYHYEGLGIKAIKFKDSQAISWGNS